MEETKEYKELLEIVKKYSNNLESAFWTSCKMLSGKSYEEVIKTPIDYEKLTRDMIEYGITYEKNSKGGHRVSIPNRDKNAKVPYYLSEYVEWDD